jgi:hypothetical protein
VERSSGRALAGHRPSGWHLVSAGFLGGAGEGTGPLSALTVPGSQVRTTGFAPATLTAALQAAFDAGHTEVKHPGHPG